MNKIKPEQVPDVVEKAMSETMLRGGTTFKDIAAAALNAWPGKDIVGYGPPFYGIDLILPLPTEASDE